MKGSAENQVGGEAYPESIFDPVLAPLLLDLHRAVEIEALWEAGIKLFNATLPQYHNLVALPFVGPAPIFLRTTLPIRPIPNYWEKFIESDPPLAQIIRRHPGTPISFLSDDFTDEEIKSSRCYQEFMKPDGWRYGMGFLFWENGQFYGQFASIRTEEQGDYTPAERALLTELYPHFAAAVERVVLLDRERAARQAVVVGLEQIPDGRVILDWNLRVVYQNQAAVEACANWTRGTLNQPVRAKEVGNFNLPGELADAAARLLAEYRAAVNQHSAQGQDWKRTLEHPEVPGLSARIRVLEFTTPHSSEPNILIELSRVISTPSGDSARPVFKLTPSERRVAELAASGQGNQQIAQTLGVSVHTIRAHLREVFSKLGIERRSQLAKLLPD